MNYTYEKKENIEKIPRKCIRILLELEKVAPNPLHVKELAHRSNLSPIEVGRIISFYPRIFKYVEKIESKEYIQYRLNIDEKYLKKQEEIAIPLVERIKITLRIRRK
jgi:hypothetical protein